MLSPALSLPHPAAWLGIDLRWLYADLLQSILHRTRCRHQAGDVLHDALLRYAANALRQPVAQPHAYLRRVVDTVLVDHYRGGQRLVPLESADDDTAGTWQQAEPSAELLADLRQRLELLQAVLQQLPPRCREIFWMLRVEGLTQPVVAQRLGLCLKTVEGHVARALLELSGLRDHFLEH